VSGKANEKRTLNGTDEVEPTGRKRIGSLVYGAFFGLDEDPFRVTPDPRYMYTGEGREETAERFLAHVRAPKGLSLVTGGPGSGKSLVLRWLISRLPAEQPVAIIWHATFTPDDFVAAICTRMDVECESMDAHARISALHEKLGEARAQGLIPVVLVDEASSLKPEVVDLMPTLLGAEGGEEPLVSVVGVDAVGCDRFVDAVKIPVAQEWKLASLDREEVANYVRHRVNLAGGDGEHLFEAEALERVAELSGGVPRVINGLCGKALLLAYLGDEHQVSARTVGVVGILICV